MKKFFLFLAVATLAFAGCKNDDAVSVTSVSLDETAITLEIGAKQTLVATVLPENADNKTVTWTSSDETVATVNASGEVTAVAAGSVVITVTTTDGKKTDVCNVTVNPAAVVIITGDEFDITEEQTIYASEATDAHVQVNVEATKGIDSFLIEITSSSPVFTGTLAYMGLGGEFDIANPTAELAAALSNPQVNLPHGDAIKGETDLAFDISHFIPVIFSTAGACTVEFKLTVSDEDGNNDSQTLKLELVEEISIVGDGFDIDEALEVLESESDQAVVKVDVSAMNGIETFMVHIDCTRPSFMALLGFMLGNDFDLASPGELASKLEIIKLPYGDAVKGKTELEFDISNFVPMIFAASGTDDFTASFQLTVSDDSGNSKTKTLMLDLVDDVD